MIRDARVLRTGFVPREVEHRDTEVNYLSSILRPLTDDNPVETVLISGPSGAGKTCISQFVTERLREQALDTDSIYVNCWRNHTPYRVLYQLLESLGKSVDIHRQSTPFDELVDRLQQYSGERVVTILDEVDQLDDPDLLYHLHSLPQFALIAILNKPEELLYRVDNRLESRLQSSGHIRLDPYSDEELHSILAARVRWGLEQDVITEGQLYDIADAAAGDARLAIGILRTAARLAERQSIDRITPEIITEAVQDARTEIRQRNLDSLTPHQQVVYEIISDAGPLRPSDIHERYSDAVDDPRTMRTLRSYLRKMVQYNLIDASGTSRDREYFLVDAGPAVTTD